jgi:hypothetical protein
MDLRVYQEKQDYLVIKEIQEMQENQEKKELKVK